MKFILPLFLSLSLASARSMIALSDQTYFLSPPSFTQTDAQTVTVAFQNGPGTDTMIYGETNQVISVGACTDGAGLKSMTTASGITNNYNPSTDIGGPTDYETTYTFNLNLEDEALDVTPDGTNTGTLNLCVAHFFEEGGLIPNFQMTDLTITFDLLADSISFMTFQTSANSPDSRGTNVQIGVTATLCAGNTPFNQNQIICFRVCPDAADVGNDFFVGKLPYVQATIVGGSFVQPLTDSSGIVTNANLVSVEQGTDPDCQKIDFYLDSNFFLTGASAVQLSGQALLADKGNPFSTRRLGSNSRALSTQVTKSEFELEIELVKPEDSAAVAVTVTRFVLAGAAGAALMI